MEIPIKKLVNGFEMPVFGLGTWQMGGWVDRDPDNDDAADVRAIETAIEMGISHIDTAEKYANGHAEVLVGKAVKRFDRDSVFIATKVSSAHASASDVAASAEASLRRMEVDHVDLYLLHSFTDVVPLEETMAAMNQLVERGLVRAIGVSNFGPSNLQKVQAVSERPLVVNQVHYNLAVREVETAGLLRYCQENDVLLMAWRPLRFDRPSDSSLVDELCEKYGKTPNQIAINWLVSQTNVVTLAKTSDADHLRENLGGVGWTMDQADVERIRHQYPDQQDVSDAVPLDS